MEYRLNKIDTDIRKKMKEETKSDKIHANEKINVKKDLKEYDNNRNIKNNQYENSEQKYITIDGVKSLADTFNVEVEKLEILRIDNSGGRILDTKK